LVKRVPLTKRTLSKQLVELRAKRIVGKKAKLAANDLLNGNREHFVYSLVAPGYRKAVRESRRQLEEYWDLERPFHSPCTCQTTMDSLQEL
jgi:hypothetical protein